MGIMSDVRRVRRQQHSLLNRLRSCASDADFVSEFHAGHLSGLTVFANLRQGQWYTPPDAMTCHFKSSDGHCGAWKFNPRRVNVHLVAEAIRGGGLIIVDSTRKGKRVPDSFSRTIPIWATVLNRIAQRRTGREFDTGLHMHGSVSEREKVLVEDHIEEFISVVVNSCCDLSVLDLLTRPLRCIWVDRSSVWTDVQHRAFSERYLAVICLTTSFCESEVAQHDRQGAGDDHENWSGKLTPSTFARHRGWILSADSDEECLRRIDALATEGNGRSLAGTSLVSIGSTEITIRLHVALSVLPTDGATVFISTGALSDPDVRPDVYAVHVSDVKGRRPSLETALGGILDFCLQWPTVTIASDRDAVLPGCVAVAILSRYFTGLGDELKRGARGDGPALSKERIRRHIEYVQRFIPGWNPPRFLVQQLNRFFLGDPAFRH
ncbi:hypothetical protein PBRA_006617 [Plasmodiophora brassicae]|uniref:Initiator tRNA phosphoribosyl transferase n=1 Tax=Plasmodiophora brassicae TaxID=37360 RepID=A0A0G4IT24_PLABS|nr:hypothetical protein PBRA_006617 [Plasmodiophora brassicae]